ncbi:MAG TPA: hypothetical protein PKH58_00535, partial [Paludibacteraceae bacterium]|nr:hypothetical protein [Paludibacteraceae bacterium]
MRKSLLKNAFLFVSVCLMMPLLSFSQFVENNGQIAHREISKLRPDIKFQVKGNEVISNYKADGIENYYCKVREVPRENWTDDMKENERMDRKVRSFQDIFFYRFDVAFIGSNPDVSIEPSDKSKTYRNYYYEFCPDGILNVPEYKTIEYQELYPGIDLRYVGTDKGIKYEFILAKGAKISDIKMKYIGVDGLNVEENGDLTYYIDGKKMTEKSPFTFYSGSGKEISSAYTLIQDDIIQFKVDGIDEVTEDITIDPVLTWSTYFQGVYGGYQGDPGVDNQGNVYICTEEGAGTLPVLNAGAGQWFQIASTGPSPNWDLAIFKFNSDLSLAWCTFYGGQACEQGWGKRNVAIDNTNNRIYFSGETDTPYSNSVQTFPTYNPGGGAFYQDVSYDNGSSYPFFLEFTPAGVRSWATLFTYETAPFSGGMGTDVESIYFRNGYLYFSGETNRYGHSGFPLRTLAGAYNNSYWPGDGQHIYCGRFNSSRTLEWCTYVNNNVATTSFSSNLGDMVVDANNNIYLVTDYSEYSASKLSTILPLVNPGAGAYFQATGGLGYGSRRGTHITKLNPSSSTVLWGTFYNGGYGDLPGVCEVDASNNFYVGWRSTGSTDFPCYNPGSGAYYQSTKRSVCLTGPNDYANGGKDGAVAKFTSAGVRLWATYINGTTPTSGETGVNDIDTYPTGEMMMSSKTVCSDFPVQYLSGSYNKSTITTSGTYENVFTKFSSGGVILWSSYFQPLMGYGAIQNNNCVSKYFVDNGGGSTIPLVNPGSPAYYSSTPQNYQSFQLFEDATSNQSTPASSISASPTTTICTGGSVTLTVQGGSLGSGASWQWFSGSCGGTFVGSGASVNVSPTSNTNYYVRATGVCNTTSCVSLLVTVTPNNTISLSAGGTQTKCINTAITTTTYATTGATGATITGLPTGVTGSWASNTVTISGTPTAAGVYTYTVALTGGCGTTTTTGIITVTPNNTITLSSGNNTQTRCINSAIANISYTSTGATGATFSGLPSGVSGNYSSGNITISGTPSASGTFNYTVNLTGGCGTVSATGTITVTPNNTITLSSGNNTQTRCINSAIANISYTSTGATGATFSGLPSGVSGNYSSGNITISGTPSASGTFNYTVTLTGGCGTASANGTITVTPNNTITLSSGNNTQTRCINTAIANISYTTTGATGATFSGLPSGVSGSYSSGNITISGTPSASGTFNYTVNLTGGCGTVSANGTITVTPNNTVSVASSTPTLCINTPLTAITHTTSGATGIGSATGLPAGVTASWASNTITISGTPMISGTFSYSIPLTGGCGTANATGTITVIPNNTITLVAGGTQTKCINTAITTTTYATTGATGATVTGLPSGVSGSWASNVVSISGSPTVSGAFTYTVTLTGGCGTVTANGTITVTPTNTVTAASSTPTLCINTALTAITHTTSGATGIGTSSGLPAGVTASWASNTITISGTPTASGTFNYSIPLTGGCGTTNATGTITVIPNNTITLVAGGTQTKCINTAITTTTYATTGATGATITGLPSGVSGSWASNVVSISGSPTVSGAFTYTVTLTGG